MDQTAAPTIKQQLSAQFNQLAHQLGVLTFQADAVKRKLEQINQQLLAEEAKDAVGGGGC